MAIVPVKIPEDPTPAVIDPPPQSPEDSTSPQPDNWAAAQPHLNFWQKPWVQSLLPLLTSVAVHATTNESGISKPNARPLISSAR